MKDQQRILISGAAGTIGTALLKEILRQKKNYDINVFDIDSRNVRRRLSAFGDKVHTFYGDIARAGDLDEACRDRDVVIHLAAVIPPLADEFPELAARVNEGGTINLIRTLERLAPAAFLLYASSIAVYGDRLNDPDIRVGDPLKCSQGDMYARTKINTEKLIQDSALDWSIFRLTAIMGVNNHKISKLMFHMPLNTPMEIATPEDTARAFANAIENSALLSRRIFNLSGGSACRIRYNDFLSRSFRIFGLGKLNFPRQAFAGRNFHCGYYADGDDLETILHFRRDNIESYFSRVKRSVSNAQRNLTRIFRSLIKYQLLKQSEPLRALRKHNIPLIRRFFGREPGPVK
ncbi:MAG: NAD(P)-dependent oxidoreductase [Candidatus Marinimicrobia bacterium]|nr:NAD(P)-dependent oxidoreductase [Candidatus Neomarinimicrobiota bacterium]